MFLTPSLGLNIVGILGDFMGCRSCQEGMNQVDVIPLESELWYTI
jgi:hypothetical protein